MCLAISCVFARIGQQDDPHAQVDRRKLDVIAHSVEKRDSQQHGGFTRNTLQHGFHKPGQPLQDYRITVGMAEHDPLRHSSCSTGEGQLAQVLLGVDLDLSGVLVLPRSIAGGNPWCGVVARLTRPPGHNLPRK